MAWQAVVKRVKRYPGEFKIEVMRQVSERGHRVAEVAEGLGITTHGLYSWIQNFGKRKPPVNRNPPPNSTRIG